jgi:hypothetical protein
METKIRIETQKTGYSLTVGTSQYFYFTLDKLVGGFFYHVALGNIKAISVDYIEAILEAIPIWKKSKDSYHDIAKIISENKSHLHDLQRYGCVNWQMERELNKTSEKSKELQNKLMEVQLQCTLLEEENDYLKEKVKQLQAIIDTPGKLAKEVQKRGRKRKQS